MTGSRPFGVKLLAGEVFLVGALEVDQSVILDFDNAGGEGGDELPVVTDKDQRAGVEFQRQVERFDSLHIQVVGGLVHDQDVAVHHHQFAEQQAVFLAAGTDLALFLVVVGGDVSGVK